MFLDKDSIKLNGTSIGPFLVEAKYQYSKLWSSDSGRNLAGKMSGSLIGIFVKITCSFGRLTKTQLETLAPILDSAYQQLTYYDPVKKSNVTIETYSGDWDNTSKNIGENSPFSISFIATQKRS